jgi:hypothetical protein
MTETKCPECQVPFAAQGLAAHREATHGAKPMTKAQVRRMVNRLALEERINAMAERNR